MTEYFAVIDDDNRRGPFDTMHEPIALLKQASRDRGYTDEQANHFFLHQSAVEQVDTVGGKVECFSLGWRAREESGRDEESSSENTAEILSHDELARESESARAEAHFTVPIRKAAEVNEGGLVDANVP
jgi:hypothetical protein